MFTRSIAALTAGLIVVASGCTATSPVVRGQSPIPHDAIQPVNFQTKGIETHPVYDATLGHNANMGTTFHDNSRHFEPDAGCPSCPSTWSATADIGCPGQCGHGCGGRCLHPKFIRDSRSYSYKAPTDLRYPMQGQTGGSIVYPYYTHKGPSDFFRK